MLLNKRISIHYFVQIIKWDIIAIAIYAVLAGSFDHYGFLKVVTIPLAISAFVGTTLSLLLAFRTAQSYERWWEARIVWGAIVNDSRSLIRQIRQFLPKNKDADATVETFVYRQIIWCFSLSESLRKMPFSNKVKNYLKLYHIQTDNIPNCLLNKHAEDLSEISARFNLDPNKQVQIDMTLTKLCDSMGKCERIKNTIFPRSYSVLIHFLIYVLMTILPFGLEDRVKGVEILLTFIIPVLFICIERTAIIMQDPFENVPTDIPMTTLSATIERNLLEMIGKKNEEISSKLSSYYIM